MVKIARKTIYNEVCTPEIFENMNKDNISLMNEFIEYLNSTDKSDLTIYNYISDLKICFAWSYLYNNNKFFVDFTKRDFMKYQNYLINELKLSSSRIRRLRSTMSSLANFIENILDEDFPNFRNIVNKIPAPAKDVVRDKTIISEEQLKQLLDYLVNKREYQKACLVALAAYSGARKSELLRFKTSYFKDENIMYGSLYKTEEKIKVKGRGKKGKQIYKYTLVNLFKPYLELWLKERQELEIDSQWLFVVERNSEWVQMPISTADCWADTFTKILGVDFYFHMLRHFFTTYMYRSGLPSEVIKDIVGWENVSMVSTYLDIEVDEELGKYFDENGIKNVEQKGLSDI